MAILDILHYPDPKLREKAAPVDEVTDEIRTFIDNMFETMYEAPGIGLAAVQVNDFRRIIVIDLSEDQNEPMALINPVILEKSGEEEAQEGCLSVPGYYENVTRAEHVVVKALNTDGEEMQFEADELLAVCIQHEIDHLDGKLFVDYISNLKRQRIRKKLEKEQRKAG